MDPGSGADVLLPAIELHLPDIRLRGCDVRHPVEPQYDAHLRHFHVQPVFGVCVAGLLVCQEDSGDYEFAGEEVQGGEYRSGDL